MPPQRTTRNSRSRRLPSTSSASAVVMQDSQIIADPSQDLDPAAPVSTVTTQREALEEEERRLDEQIRLAELQQRVRAKQEQLARLQQQTGTPPTPVGTNSGGTEPPRHTSATTPIQDAPVPQDVSLGLVSPTQAHPFRSPTLATPSYHGKTFMSLQNFIYDCESRFRLTPTLRTHTEKIAYAVSCLHGAPKTAWIQHIAQLSANPSFLPEDLTWEEFVDFLHTENSDPSTRAFDAYTELQNISQRPDETVSQVAERYRVIEFSLRTLPPEEQRVISFIRCLRPDIRQLH